MDQNLTQASQKIRDAVEHLQRELSAIRAGRANPSILEDIPVSAYGTRMKMMEVGTISAPQPSLLTIQVWDASLVKDVEKAIMDANLGLTTSSEGNTVRVPIPPLTEERREEFTKVARNRGEESKIEVRQIRSDTKEAIEKAKEDGEIGEDQMHQNLEKLQDLVENANMQIDELVEKKAEELRQI